MTHSDRPPVMYRLVAVGAAEQPDDVYNQVMDMGLDYQWEASTSVSGMPPYAAPMVAPAMGSFRLNPATTPTDLLTESVVASPGLLVSLRLSRTLASVVHQPYEEIAATVHHGDVSFPYRWLQLTQPLEYQIDYSRSAFVARSYGVEPQAVVVASEVELRQRCAELVLQSAGDMSADRVTFLPGTPRFDLFSVRLTDITYFASRRLATRLLAERITGIRLVPADATFIFT